MPISMTPEIAVIHAVDAAMAPVENAFLARWPHARRFSIVDDGLPSALESAGGVTRAIVQRIGRLADHALASGADAVLFTCSAFGTAIEAAAERAAVPVLKPNQAMFETALKQERIGMLATFAAAVPSGATTAPRFGCAAAICQKPKAPSIMKRAGTFATATQAQRCAPRT